MTPARLHRRSRRLAAGFTLLEVMMALTVLAIGMLGVVALQGATIGATQDAQQFSIANSVARTWLQRLQRDAQRWNHPSAFRTDSDLTTDTAFLNMVSATTPMWTRPNESPLEPGASPAFDRMGNDIPLADPRFPDAVYCAHLRLRQLYPDMIKAEVRVLWKKRRLGNGTAYAALGLTSGVCTAGTEAAVGADTANFHWVYAVTGITKSRAQ